METKLKHSQVMKSNCHSLAHSVMSANPVQLATIHKWPKSMCMQQGMHGVAWRSCKEHGGTPGEISFWAVMENPLDFLQAWQDLGRCSCRTPGADCYCSPLQLETDWFCLFSEAPLIQDNLLAHFQVTM